MLATPIIIYAIRRRRTYRQRKKPDALTCAIRHRRCEGCPFKDFFKPEQTTNIKESPDK